MDINASGQSADISLPTFWTPLSENDVILLRKRNRRRRFDISIVYAVAARCSFGFPQVLVCRPERKEGSPFPTLFWLTCPYLDRKCGELESLHKIRELEELFSTRPTEVARWHKEYALLRKSISETGIDIPTGVGGIDSQELPMRSNACIFRQPHGLDGDTIQLQTGCKRVWGCGMFQRTLRELRSASAETSGMKRVVSQRHRT